MWPAAVVVITGAGLGEAEDVGYAGPAALRGRQLRSRAGLPATAPQPVPRPSRVRSAAYGFAAVQGRFYLRSDAATVPAAARPAVEACLAASPLCAGVAVVRVMAAAPLPSPRVLDLRVDGLGGAAAVDRIVRRELGNAPPSPSAAPRWPP